MMMISVQCVAKDEGGKRTVAGVHWVSHLLLNPQEFCILTVRQNIERPACSQRASLWPAILLPFSHYLGFSVSDTKDVPTRT